LVPMFQIFALRHRAIPAWHHPVFGLSLKGESAKANPLAKHFGEASALKVYVACTILPGAKWRA
jgi:hypothetical protein